MNKQLKIDFLTPQREELYNKTVIKPSNTKLYKFFVLDKWKPGVKKAVVYTKDISYAQTGMMVRDSRKTSIKKVLEPNEVEKVKNDARWELCSEVAVDLPVDLGEAPIIHNQWFVGVLVTNKIIFKQYI